MEHPHKEKQPSERYRDRDLDWLNFNQRVLQEAANPEVPLFERIRFLAIFSSNLDEFFRVRVSKLRQLKEVEKGIRRRLSLRPNRSLKAIISEVDRQQQLFGHIFRERIRPALEKEGIFILKPAELQSLGAAWAEEEFYSGMAKNCNLRLDGASERPFLQNGAAYLMAYNSETGERAYFPCSSLRSSRFIALPPDGTAQRFAILDDLLRSVYSRALSWESHHTFFFSIKLSRDAELYLDETYERSIVQEIYQSLAQRPSGQPTRLLYDQRMPVSLRKQLRKELGLARVDMVPGGMYHNFSDFMAFPNPGNPKLEYVPMPPLDHPVLRPAIDYFEAVARRDILLHCPYQDFGRVLDWLEQAAADPHVRSIKISLYRIASDSRLAHALIGALRNGIDLTIFVEAKARFDEENNLEWGRVFERHGAKVLYSFPGIKVHSKIFLIERKTDQGPKYYSYIGTGNFNEKTSRFYADHALLTAHPGITSDMRAVFAFLERPDTAPDFKYLMVSPFNTRQRFEGLIRREIEQARQGSPAAITAKMNSLEDKGMIDLLYEASQAGVKVRLLVRGFCCLLPRVEGLSENILVTSIVDRFLEHGRLYLFHNGGQEELYMGSADWMKRNLDRRVEVLVPVRDPDAFEELSHILELQMKDNEKARLVDPKASNSFRRRPEGMRAIRSQYAIYEYLKQRQHSGR